MAQYPWLKIFEKYRTGKYTMKELSEEYGFNHKYALRKAKEEGVEKGSSRREVEREAAKKIKKQEIEKEAKLREEYEKIINNIRRDTANELFNRNTDFDRLKQLKIGSQIIHNCRKEQWEVNEILETADQAEIAHQTDKLEALIGGIKNAPIEK